MPEFNCGLKLAKFTKVAFGAGKTLFTLLREVNFQGLTFKRFKNQTLKTLNSCRELEAIVLGSTFFDFQNPELAEKQQGQLTGVLEFGKSTNAKKAIAKSGSDFKRAKIRTKEI